MDDLTKGDIYVVEFVVPAGFWGSPRIRQELPRPDYYGVTRGYWRMAYEDDDIGTKRPKGMLVTVEVLAASLTDAEDRALYAGERLSAIAALQAGSPPKPPELKRIGRIDAHGRLAEQHAYHYWGESGRVPRVGINLLDFQRLLTRVPSIPVDLRGRLEVAIHWYGIAISALDPRDGYLGAWIGLEALGTALDSMWHTKSSVCPSVQRSDDTQKRRAGLEHTIRHVAVEAFSGREIQDLANIRNEIGHGSTEHTPDELRSIADELFPDLLISLGVGILTLIRRSVAGGETDLRWSGALPSDHEPHPDARFGVSFETPMGHHHPWEDRWASISWEWTDRRSRLEPSGEYIWGAGMKVEIEATAEGPEPQVTQEAVLFDRRGTGTNNPPSDLTPLPVVIWRERPLRASWRRMLPDNHPEK